jgi:hypothetical protein
LREEILRLREELKGKEELLSRRDNIVYDRQMYWLQAGDERRDGPYCPACFDARGKLVRLFQFANDSYWRRKECGHLLDAS